MGVRELGTLSQTAQTQELAREAGVDEHALRVRDVGLGTLWSLLNPRSGLGLRAVVFGSVWRLQGPLINGWYHGLTLSLSLPICKWAQEPLTHRVAMKDQCLAQGGIQPVFTSCPPFWWVGLTPTRPLPPNRQVIRQRTPSPPIICCPNVTLPLTELLGLGPGTRKWRWVK